MIKKVVKKISKNIAHKWDQIESQKVGGSGKIKVTCFGGAEEVTGSNFVLEFGGKKIMVDCGLPQGLDAKHKEWIPFAYDVSEIDYLLVTHAHMDHIGRIPFLLASGFVGQIFSTKPTLEMSKPAFDDALHILTKNLEKGKIDNLPYQKQDIEDALSKWKTVEYRENLILGDNMKSNFSAVFTNSSHILGSAFIQINCNGEKVLFTGDMGDHSLLLQEADIPTDSDIVFMETVYGGRTHEHVDDRSEYIKKIIIDDINNKGTLVIPAFAIERTQEILKEINDLVETNKIKKIPVYVDSPLAIKMTEVFAHHKELMSNAIKSQMRGGDDIFKFPGLHFTETHDESIAINDIPGPKIIIAGSGMVAGGRVVHHVQKYMEGKKNTIMLAGYQAMGTYGRLLSDGKKEIVMNGEAYAVNAKVVQLSGYSAHRDQNSLLEFVKIIAPTCNSLNLILGDIESLEAFRKFAYEKLNIKAHICMKGEVLDF
jgi:metallo-beta-lactamase family protein